MKVRLALVAIAFVLVALGVALWVQAGTRHMDALPYGPVELTSGPRDDGPNRAPARMAWTGAAVCIVGAVVYRKRD
jgi:hypothetical protein